MLAERYFHDDAPTALAKLRSFAELMAKEIAATHAMLPGGHPTFDEVLGVLRRRGVLPSQIADIFYLLKRVGNLAVHENSGTSGDALSALKLARNIAVWFHQSYGGAPNFRVGAFVPPPTPRDATDDLRKELDQLRTALKAKQDAETAARLVAAKAEEERLTAIERAGKLEEERLFWSQYAAETEARVSEAETRLAELQKQAEAAPPQQLDLLATTAAALSEKIELDEKSTRLLIDEHLRAAGWEVDSAVMRHANGVRPEYGRAMAIAEWPTRSGPVDYALFVDGRCLGVIEAKRGSSDVPGRLSQAKRYARDIDLDLDALQIGRAHV